MIPWLQHRWAESWQYGRFLLPFWINNTNKSNTQKTGNWMGLTISHKPLINYAVICSRNILNYHTLCLKKRTNFETVYLKIMGIDFDDIRQKYSKYSRIKCACFSFHVGLLFYQLFVFQTGHRKYRKFWQLHLTLPVNVAHSVKKTKFWSKVGMNVKLHRLVVYNKVSW